jgi:hypothetical protein
MIREVVLHYRGASGGLASHRRFFFQRTVLKTDLWALLQLELDSAWAGIMR